MKLIMYSLAHYVQIAVSICLLIKIVSTQNCKGLSRKSQHLYALAYIAGYADSFFSRDVSTNEIIIGAFHVAFGVSIVLAIYLFNRTHQGKFDTSRIATLIICCLIVALFVQEKFTFLHVSRAFGAYLGATAVLPQARFVENAKRVRWHVFFYFLALGICSVLECMHLAHVYYRDNEFDRIEGAANVVKFVLCFDFLFKAFPYVGAGKNRGAVIEEQRTVKNYVRVGKNVVPAAQRKSNVDDEDDEGEDNDDAARRSYRMALRYVETRL